MVSISSASPAFTGKDPHNRLFGPLPDVTAEAGYGEDHPPRVGFFTDTSVCIGCKACEVACKEWNTLPMDDSHGTRDVIGLSGMSYDNTGQLGANSWRHVAFIEQVRTVDLPMPTFGRPGDDRHGSAPRPPRRPTTSAWPTPSRAACSTPRRSASSTRRPGRAGPTSRSAG